ncbi:MAG: hypothetical protein PWP65_1083 [Clostridia bacterium]|nr:hypothetical protein [Clostridia bacterium]
MNKLWHDMKSILWYDPFRPRLLASLVIINLLGSVYGYYWYHQQLAATPAYWWPFIPDSPLSTTLFGLALLLTLSGRHSRWLALLAAAAVVKYGFWAMVLISHYWLRGAPVGIIEFLLWLSHLGMAAEGLLYLRHWPANFRQAAGLFFWMALNDFLDYRLDLHPYLFRNDQFGLALAAAAILTAALGLLLFLSAIKNFSMAGKAKKRKNIIR